MRIWLLLLGIYSTTTVSAQSFYLLVGTYTNKGTNNTTPPQDSTGSKGIYLYRWDAATGQASFLSHTDVVMNPSYLEIAPDGQHVYAVTDSRTQAMGSVSAFRLDREKGRLEFINKQPSGGANPVYVAVHRSGRWVAVANYTGGNLAVLPTGSGGALLPYAQLAQHTGHSINPTRQEKPHVHSVVFSPDFRSLYAQDLGEDSVSIYTFDSAEPMPLHDSGKIATTPGSGPRHLTFHPNGRYAYLVEEMGGSVDVYRWYPGTGHLQLLQRVATHPDTARGPFRSADVHVSADGRYLYVTNRESESNITTFSIDTDKGTLRTIGYTPVLGKEPRNFTIDPTGRYLLVGNQDSDEVVIFKIDEKSGLPRPTGQRIKVPSPTCLKMAE